MQVKLDNLRDAATGDVLVLETGDAVIDVTRTLLNGPLTLTRATAAPRGSWVGRKVRRVIDSLASLG